MGITHGLSIVLFVVAAVGCGSPRARALEPAPATSETTTAPEVVRVVPRGTTVRVTPREGRLVLGTDVTLHVGAPIRDEASGAWSVPVVAVRGADGLLEEVACDRPISLHGVTLTVHSSLSTDGLVGYTIQVREASPMPECASDADCTLSSFVCCGVACGPRAAHIDVLAAVMELCEGHICEASPGEPCPDEPPPARAACVGGLCATIR